MTIVKNKKLWVALYVIFLGFCFFYIRAALKEETLSSSEKENKRSFEVKPVSVTLVVENAADKKVYTARLQNVDTIMDLLDNLREKQGFIYDKTGYIYGVEIDYINKVQAPTGYKWKLFLNNVDITYVAASKKLEDNAVYELKLMKSN